MVELEKFPGTLKQNMQNLLGKKQSMGIKDQLEKVGNKSYIKELGMQRLSWFILTQLEQWMKDCIKRKGKCRELMIYEE